MDKKRRKKAKKDHKGTVLNFCCNDGAMEHAKKKLFGWI
jgi:hypothetical protein